MLDRVAHALGITQSDKGSLGGNRIDIVLVPNLFIRSRIQRLTAYPRRSPANPYTFENVPATITLSSHGMVYEQHTSPNSRIMMVGSSTMTTVEAGTFVMKVSKSFLASGGGIVGVADVHQGS
jgi:hypothetical protein